MIKLDKITKVYNENVVLNNFSLNISENEFVSIMGPSGSGKTTLLNIMGLLERADSGVITICNIKNPTKKEIIHLKRYVLGYIFQNYLLMNNETVETNILISQKYSTSFSEEKMIETLNKVKLNESYLKKNIYQLSGGEQQRVAFARLLLKPSKIILADEPTGNLDKENSNIIFSLLEEIRNEGKTIVFVTHNEELAMKADRIIKIEKNLKML